MAMNDADLNVSNCYYLGLREIRKVVKFTFDAVHLRFGGGKRLKPFLNLKQMKEKINLPLWIQCCLGTKHTASYLGGEVL